jgi:glycerol-3-phosphate O-acyltransferase
MADPVAQPPTEREPPSATRATVAAAGADPFSAMAPRFGLPFRWFARRFFRHFGLDEASVARLRALEARGAIVYVMRYASRLDYFLFNTLFRREGLRLSAFANGIRFYYYRPFWEALRVALRRPRAGPKQERDLHHARGLAREGGSFFLFLRTARLRSVLWGRRRAALEGKAELDLLREVVDAAWDADRAVHLVPLALFWRKGPRARRSFLNLFYGAATRPSDLAKVTSFLTTYRDLSVKVGEPIDLAAFIAKRREEGPETVARMVRRSILTFLYREEKVVEGPTLRPRQKVQELVMAEPRVEAAIRARAEEREVPEERARFEAERMFREIAANMNSTFLAVLNALVGAVVRRLFASVEVAGLEKVAEYAKRHPLVLVPSHRSYFDFLIVSMLFYANYLVPPHILARENMAFGPFGFLWRRCGAFFVRRSMDDALYKEVFRAYVAYLVKEGVTQEFFIEGGRSRTGKTLAPRLGMLGWVVEAFLETARRDLFFVPIAITYERLVEEGAMVEELEGAEKKDESVLGLVRARKYLQRRFGSVFVNFGAPISLADALGDRRDRFARDGSEEAARERRDFVGALGNRIAERINWAMVPAATGVAACALLGERSRGVLRARLVARMQQVVDLLRLQDVGLTPALEADLGTFDDSIAAMLRAGLIRSSPDPRGEILYFEESKRRALDFYRNSVVNFLAAPSFLARGLLAGGTPEELRAATGAWLDLFYTEFFPPRGEILAAHLDAFLDHFERAGWVERRDGRLVPAEKGLAPLRFLAEQTRAVLEAYAATFAAVLAAPRRPLSPRELRRAAEEQFARAALLGEVWRREGANPVTFANAAELLVRCGVLERVELAARREQAGETGFARGPRFDELPALRERLAAALAAG